MASANDYLAEIRRLYPKTLVNDSLMGELNRRSAEGATVDQVVNDASGYGQIQEGIDAYARSQAAAQVDPELQAGQADLTNERTVAEQNAKRLQEAVSKVYAQRRQNDPLARQGIVSGAAQDYVTNQEVDQTKGINEDLGSKLSYIAQRLTNLNSSAQTKRTALTEQYRGEALGEVNRNLSARDQMRLDQQAAAERSRQQEFENQLALANLDLSRQRESRAGSAASSDSGFASILSSILGGSQAPSQQPAPAALSSIRDEIAKEFTANYRSLAGKDSQYIDYLQAKYPGYDRQALTDLFYQTRKPFEQTVSNGIAVRPAGDNRTVTVRR